MILFFAAFDANFTVFDDVFGVVGENLHHRAIKSESFLISPISKHRVNNRKKPIKQGFLMKNEFIAC